MKPCYGYIRVSTTRQGDGASLEAQKDAITGFASQNNLTITKWFEEQETASKAGRPIFEELLRDLGKGAAEGVVIHKIDRSSRNYSDWARLHDLAQSGIKIFFAADSLDFDTRGGQLLADIQMALAADYSRNLSLEVKKGIYGRIKQGVFPFRAPLGYLDTGGGNLKAVDPIKAPLIQLAFNLYCSGEYSITSLTEEMVARGLTGFAGRPVVRRNIETMLRNPFYIGKILVCGKLYPASHEPLITTEQFQEVAAIKAKRSQKKVTKHRLLFQGLLTCDNCGKGLTGERQKTHVYYRCHTPDCANGSIREDRLETQLLRILKRFQINPTERCTLETRMKSWFSTTGVRNMEKSIRMRIADVSTKHDRLTDLLVDGHITQADYDLRKRNADFELQRLREELRGVEDTRKAEQDLEDLLSLATNLHTLFRAAPPKERRALVKNCLLQPTVCQGTLKAKPAAWLRDMKKMQRNHEYTPAVDTFASVAPISASLSQTPTE